jgi:hypothetical protein
VAKRRRKAKDKDKDKDKARQDKRKKQDTTTTTTRQKKKKTRHDTTTTMTTTTKTKTTTQKITDMTNTYLSRQWSTNVQQEPECDGRERLGLGLGAQPACVKNSVHCVYLSFYVLPMSLILSCACLDLFVLFLFMNNEYVRTSHEEKAKHDITTQDKTRQGKTRQRTTTRHD